jgi:hypothetical protein
MTAGIQNTGSVPGHEVVQLYIDFPHTAGEPKNQLKRFTKTVCFLLSL